MRERDVIFAIITTAKTPAEHQDCHKRVLKRINRKNLYSIVEETKVNFWDTRKRKNRPKKLK